MSLEPEQQILKRIQLRLDALKMSERAATKLAKLSPSAIRNLREGKARSPKLDTIVKLAAALTVTPEWLAFGVESKPSMAAPHHNEAKKYRPEIADFCDFLDVLEPEDLEKARSMLLFVFAPGKTDFRSSGREKNSKNGKLT